MDISTELNGKEVNLLIVECPTCHGALGLDTSFIDQVAEVVNCPYCKSSISVLGQGL